MESLAEDSFNTLPTEEDLNQNSEIDTCSILRFWEENENGKKKFNESYYLEEIITVQQQFSIEFWKEISGYEGLYLCSNLARVKYIPTGRIKQINTEAFRKRGAYTEISLSKDKKSKTHRLHRIIALTWLLNPDNLSDVNHIDGNKFNNILNNLEWISHKDNVKHSVKLGLDPKNNAGRAVLQLNPDTKEEIKRWQSAKKAGEALKLNPSNITQVCLGRRQTTGGFDWKYVENHKSIQKRKIPGYKGYFTSEDGDIFNTFGQKMRTRNLKGYRRTTLYIGSKSVHPLVHRLVAATYIPNPEGKPNVNHIDGNPLNNHFSNLEWCDQKENMNSIETKKKISRIVGKYSREGELLETFPSVKAVATTLGVLYSTMYDDISKNTIREGIYWEFLDPPLEKGKK
ncbi:MAG: HNH endonuclease [Candidatus Woesearchaeota archaeon]|jgi:hypothetical protein